MEVDEVFNHVGNVANYDEQQGYEKTFLYSPI